MGSPCNKVRSKVQVCPHIFVGKVQVCPHIFVGKVQVCPLIFVGKKKSHSGKKSNFEKWPPKKKNLEGYDIEFCVLVGFTPY